MGKALAEALKTKDFSAFIDKWGEDGLSAFKKITNKLKDKDGLSDFFKKNGPEGLIEINKDLKPTINLYMKEYNDLKKKLGDYKKRNM